MYTLKKQQTINMKETAEVNSFMEQMDHPLKAEIDAVRKIILYANEKVAERVKWNSPSFYYIKDIAAMPHHKKEFVQVVFVYPSGLPEKEHGILEGNYKDRRIAVFHSMEEIDRKKDALEQVVNDWVELMDLTT